MKTVVKAQKPWQQKRYIHMGGPRRRRVRPVRLHNEMARFASMQDEAKRMRGTFLFQKSRGRTVHKG